MGTIQPSPPGQTVATDPLTTDIGGESVSARPPARRRREDPRLL